jgi:hypothetical protein
MSSDYDAMTTAELRKACWEMSAKLDETEAALRGWCEFIGFAGRDFVKRFVEGEMRKRGLWRDPEPKEESDATN